MSFGDFYRGRQVLVTGDTGFKGSWLCAWLNELGANVHGLGLSPVTEPSLFDMLRVDSFVQHTQLDIREASALAEHVKSVRPDVVFHLAAQALVRASYDAPLETLATNVMGTANLLAAVQGVGYRAERPCSVVVVTSDKCYENRESYFAYCEDDAMGGHDVYSASKGCAELVVSSWRRSFLSPRGEAPAIRLASCRAGNVIGGGDWSADRIVVDAMRALGRDEPILVRNPASIRPWQHVLESLSGYLVVGEAMAREPEFCTSWNFGPGRASERSVAELCDSLIRHWGSGHWRQYDESAPKHEARFLKLAIDKAWHHLAWQPIWDFEDAVRETVVWYRLAKKSGGSPAAMRELTASQIASFTSCSSRKSVAWAK